MLSTSLKIAVLATFACAPLTVPALLIQAYGSIDKNHQAYGLTDVSDDVPGLWASFSMNLYASDELLSVGYSNGPYYLNLQSLPGKQYSEWDGSVNRFSGFWKETGDSIGKLDPNTVYQGTYTGFVDYSKRNFGLLVSGDALPGTYLTPVAVPEPTTPMALGFGALVLLVKRRNKGRWTPLAAGMRR